LLWPWPGNTRWICHISAHGAASWPNAIGHVSSSGTSAHDHMLWKRFLLEWLEKTWGLTLFRRRSSASWAPNRLDWFLSLVATEPLYQTSGEWFCLEWLGIPRWILISAPAAVSWGPNRIDTFVIGTITPCTTCGGTVLAWSGWENLGGYCLEGVAAASWAPNRLDCFLSL